MKVSLIHNVFIATQWFKVGDHPAISSYMMDYYQRWSVCDGKIIVPGTWIVEMFDGIHLYNEEEFKNLFREAGRWVQG